MPPSPSSSRSRYRPTVVPRTSGGKRAGSRLMGGVTKEAFALLPGRVRRRLALAPIGREVRVPDIRGAGLVQAVRRILAQAGGAGVRPAGTFTGLESIVVLARRKDT